MAINSYDDTKIAKRGIWVTITRASCIMSFKLRHVRARLNSIFVGYGNLLVYSLDVFSRIPARKTQIIFSSKIKGSPQRLSHSRSALQRLLIEYNTWSFPGLGYEIDDYAKNGGPGEV